MSTPPPRRYDDIAPRAPEGEFALGALLPGDGPLELDIGFGRGNSVFERATLAPGSRLLACEIKAKLAYQVAERCQKRGYTHVRVLCGDVREILTRTTDHAVVQQVSVHFPDPWWKRRHTRRRVVGDELLDALGRLMVDDGQFFVQTDVPDRSQIYVDTLRAHPAFELVGTDGLIDANPFGARSNRELRAVEDGLPIFRVLARRIPRSVTPA
ncbi:MAG: tRNA (guanine-N7)-methyltransferase [Sandaracinaceae bacterium]|jgi:tRNA (guanine-N7-)-methyltransferase|nr:tRNA (guanine-N7)-methyltransferase [Sandaracinaceae bacterium]MBP7685134.1 tRNA (guanine-N7)-methyltransferase [Deltaproteobacteria bacterium]MBK7156199.1 tRNA (guanine-N7)-methyltransferase [Sandaracinaceae bacterium]MBK7778683.1 tRNA (guanine-N7)-methyltransferase [Sandaracinaceae bacterium]MBK8406628.1 tRNA (guanine-N7)-methyltransferase [Sandaracinaceae bacterium]